MNKAVPWLAGAALVVAAGVVSLNTPPADALIAPFLIRGAPDDTVHSRLLIASVQDAAFAEELTVEADEWAAEGNWLVVTVAASAPQTEIGAEISLATLVVGDRTFQSSQRQSTSLRAEDLRVGTDTIGMLAFELPADVRGGTAELHLSARYPTPELDDVIVIPIDLDDLPVERSIDMPEPRVGAR